jgi:hypothetical protein
VATLTDYLLDVRRLLHDANATYWSDADLTSFVNRAVKQRDRDTAMNRTLISFPLVSGTNNYTIGAVATSGTIIFGITRNVYDVASIVLIYGNMKYLLDQQAYSTLASLYQAYQNHTNPPSGWTKYGAGVIVFAPIPNQNYVTEWDMLCVADDLVAPTDPDPLPYPWTDPVPFLAAHWAKVELQQNEEADRFLALYTQRKDEVMATARGMMVPSHYATFPPGWSR